MDTKKLSFDEVIDSEWKKVYYEGGLGPGAWAEDGKDGIGMVFNICEVWDEFLPIGYTVKADDLYKLYNVLFYSNQMFRLLQKIQTSEARELVDRILTDEFYPDFG